MAEYGFAGKVQSTDKNEGFTGTNVNEPTARIDNTTRADLATPSPPLFTPVDVPTLQMNEGIASLAKSISSVAEVAKTNAREETTMKLALKAKAQQGTDYAINEIAAEKKRSPILQMILGQTVTYRAAEAQSIANISTQMMNHAYEEMSKLAELPQEEAIAEMTKYGDELVQGIKDPELRDYAFDRVKELMPEMAQLHYKKRYSLQRDKQIENNREHIVASKDLLINRLKHETNPQKKVALINMYRENMFNSNDPLGVNGDELSKAEHRTLVLSQIDTDLKNGDVMMYNMVRGLQKDNPRALTQTEQDTLKTSEGNYDSYHNTMASEVMSMTSMSLLGNKSYSDFKTTAKAARAQLEVWANKGTQSELDTKNMLARQAQLENMLAAGEQNWIKQGVEAEKSMNLRDMNSLDAEGMTWVEETFTPTKEQHNEADNWSVTKAVMGKTGQPEDSANMQLNTVLSKGLTWKNDMGEQQNLSPTDTALYIRDQIKGNKKAGSRLNSLVKNTLRGMKVGDAEDGKKWSDQQRTMFNAVDALARNNPQFNLDKTEQIRFAQYRSGFAAGQSADVVNVRVENALKASAEGMKSVSTDSRKEKQAHVKRLGKQAIGRDVPDSLLSQLMVQYEDAQAGSLYDEAVAEDIFISDLQGSATSLYGVLIPNGKRLEEEIQYTDQTTGDTSEFQLEDLFNFAGKIKRDAGYAGSVSLMTPSIMAMVGSMKDKDGKIFTDMSRMRLTNVEYTRGGSVVALTSAVNGSTYTLPVEELRAMTKAVTEDNLQKTKVWEATYGALAPYTRAVDRIDQTSPLYNPSMKQ